MAQDSQLSFRCITFVPHAHSYSKTSVGIEDVIIPANLIYVLIDPAIPISSFNFIQLFL